MSHYKRVPKFNIVRAHTMSCIVSYLSSHASKWCQVADHLQLREGGSCDVKCCRWSPKPKPSAVTEHGLGGPPMAAAFSPGRLFILIILLDTVQ